jgi:hypothetical protein
MLYLGLFNLFCSFRALIKKTNLILMTMQMNKERTILTVLSMFIWLQKVKIYATPLITSVVNAHLGEEEIFAHILPHIDKVANLDG